MDTGRRVLSCGTFDHFHPGHNAFLCQARSLGEELFVVVARDENVRRIKGRCPDQDEDTRLASVAANAAVDDARLGYPGADLLRVVADIAPHIIALGYDQGVPAGLASGFPDCRIVTLDAFQPDQYKSSLIRERRP
ncbi:MAG TPA: adenylyltransferase/cytidyltransferase family protein [Candidatus Latescibacteria bacterium]|jgi:cytidyltransferase-like protein|nr:adenylyltransferase/cytidyltransferase family protein [Candidatus Latescibacterota bacterium]HJP31799.1 adenylyltransferase/cytidyltransferase family protein [Candidatus Latescibacterota bacterium]